MTELFSDRNRWRAEAEDLRDRITASTRPSFVQNTSNLTLNTTEQTVLSVPAGAYGSFCMSGGISASGTVLSVKFEQGGETLNYAFALPAGQQTITIPFFCPAGRGTFRASILGGSMTVNAGKARGVFTRT